MKKVTKFWAVQSSIDGEDFDQSIILDNVVEAYKRAKQIANVGPPAGHTQFVFVSGPFVFGDDLENSAPARVDMVEPDELDPYEREEPEHVVKMGVYYLKPKSEWNEGTGMWDSDQRLAQRFMTRKLATANIPVYFANAHIFNTRAVKLMKKSR